MKNDNIHPFFAVLLLFFRQILNLPALLQNKNTRIGFHENGPYCKILTEKEPIRAQGFAEDWLCHIINTLIFIVKTTFGSEKLHFLALITKTLGFTVICVPSALKFKLNVCSFVFEGRVQFKITMNSVAHTLAIYINIASAFAICPSGTTDTCLLQTFSGKCQLEYLHLHLKVQLHFREKNYTLSTSVILYSPNTNRKSVAL